MPILFSRLGMVFKPGGTEFLSAERSTEEEIKDRGRLVAEKLLRDSPVRNILDSVFDLAMILDVNRQAVFVNKALLKFLKSEDGEGIIGFRPGEIFGCTYAYSSESGCGTTRSCHLCNALGTYSIKLLSERYLKGRVSFESDQKNGTTFFAGYPAKK